MNLLSILYAPGRIRTYDFKIKSFIFNDLCFCFFLTANVPTTCQENVGAFNR